MERHIIQVARIRARDAKPGDVVGREPDSTKGWFQLREVNPLHDGKINLSDGGVDNAISVWPLEIIGIQFMKKVTIEPQPHLPDFGPVGGAAVERTDTDKEMDDSLLEPVHH
jgi:hypothetical protein